MSREAHVRIWGGCRVRFPGATRLITLGNVPGFSDTFLIRTVVPARHPLVRLQRVKVEHILDGPLRLETSR